MVHFASLCIVQENIIFRKFKAYSGFLTSNHKKNNEMHSRLCQNFVSAILHRNKRRMSTKLWSFLELDYSPKIFTLQLKTISWSSLKNDRCIVKWTFEAYFKWKFLSLYKIVKRSTDLGIFLFVTKLNQNPGVSELDLTRKNNENNTKFTELRYKNFLSLMF